MSRDNAEVFLEWLEAINRTDIPGALQFMDPEVRFDHRVADLQGSATGLERVRETFEDFVENFDAVRVDCPDIRDLGDRVLALGTTHATGKGSGVETELPFTVVARFREGQMTHFTDFGDKGQALEAAGLVK